MKKNILVLAGDGIGPEVTQQAIKVLKAVAYKYHHQFIFTPALIGAAAIDQTGLALPKETLDLAKQSDAILLGAIGDPKYDNHPQIKIRPEQGLLAIRKELGLFANIRPIKLYRQLLQTSPLKPEIIKGTDIIFFRELIGGIYFGKPRGRSEDQNEAFDTMTYDKNSINRIANLAFQSALLRKKKICSIDKANVLACSRLWRETIDEVAQKYPKIEVTHLYVDNAAMQLIKNPTQFDIIVTANMFGDILTDLASQIAGSLGMLASASLGEKIGLYEPIHGSAPKYAGQDVVNPLATIMSAQLMLEQAFHLTKEAQAIDQAINQVLDQDYRCRDITDQHTKKKQIVGTNQMGDLVAAKIL